MIITDIDMARCAKDALLAEIGHDPRVEAVGIALTTENGYRLKVRLADEATDLAIPRQVEGVDVLVRAV